MFGMGAMSNSIHELEDAPYDEVAVVNGTVEERAFVAIYRRDDRIVGALSMNRPRLLMGYRSLIAERATWARALEKAAE